MDKEFRARPRYPNLPCWIDCARKAVLTPTSERYTWQIPIVANTPEQAKINVGGFMSA